MFSKYAVVGGKREPLKVRGETVAPCDIATAWQLFTERKAMYEEALARAAPGLPMEVSPVDGPALADCAKDFLTTRVAMVDTKVNKQDSERRWKQRTLGIMTCLSTERLRQVKYLKLLKAADIDAMILELLTRPAEYGTPLTASTVRGYAIEFRSPGRTPRRPPWRRTPITVLLPA